LSRAAQQIGDVVKLITAIAEQTNLLALNATIVDRPRGRAAKHGDPGNRAQRSAITRYPPSLA